MEQIKIVAGIFINDRNQILLLKRTPLRKSYPNKWNVLSATIEDGEQASACFAREIIEELGAIKFEVLKAGEPYVDKQKEGLWYVYPYLCKIVGGEIVLDKREHTEYKWVSVSELKRYETVPGIMSDLKSLGIV